MPRTVHLLTHIRDTTKGVIDKYIENPKMKGSGMLACIPQKGRCPNNCDDCFFQSGRSYLEPLEEKTPNMPSEKQAIDRVLRVNDGNDSSVNKDLVLNMTKDYFMKFYNTSIPTDLEGFKDPVVLTINPAKMTDNDFYKLDPIPKNLMFVRIRTNLWNIEKIVKPAVEYYSKKEVPIILTFMAYFTTKVHPKYTTSKTMADYVWRERTLNKYWAITTKAWEKIMSIFKHNKWVHSCGKVEGEKGDTHCRFCGNCLREYFATMERLRK